MNNLETLRFEISINTEENGIVKEQKYPGQAQYKIIALGDGVNLNMVEIPAGVFIMGSPEREEGRNQDESPQHEVILSSFFMSQYPITQAQWEVVMGDNPSHFQGQNRPVERVSWHEAMAFCRQLSQITGRNFSLPSEAQWEYACRAGSATPFHYGVTLKPEQANYNANYTYGMGVRGIYRHETTDVGSFSPNRFGLYDMHGNVLEWCEDLWHDNYDGAPEDGSVWLDGADESDNPGRVVRGGAWDATTWYCRSAVRLWTLPEVKGSMIGFRVVCN